MEDDDVLDAMHKCMEMNQNLGRYNFKYNFIGDYGVERIVEMMNVANWVFEVEIPERISKQVMEKYTEAKNQNKPKKGKKEMKGEEDEDWEELAEEVEDIQKPKKKAAIQKKAVAKKVAKKSAIQKKAAKAAKIQKKPTRK